MTRALDPVRVLRARARRAHLDRSGGDVAAIADRLVALHGSDPATVHVSVHARQPIRPFEDLIDDVRRAVDDDRSVLKLFAMRRTLHYVGHLIAPAVLGLARHRLLADRAKSAAKFLTEAGAPPLDAYRAPVLDALVTGPHVVEALQELVPEMALRVGLSPDSVYASSAPVSRFVLEALSVEGLVVRASGVGSWKAGKSAWARLDQWAPWLAPTDGRAAYASLLRAWLDAFGPGRLDDFVWWAGVTKRDAKLAVEDLGADVISVEVRGWAGPRLALRGPLEDDGPPAPVSLLPSLDPSGMCWTDRSPFLDPAWSRPMWDNTGNLGPTIWVDGRVVGGWACTPDGEVVTRVLDPAAAEHEGAIRDEAARLTAALDGRVVTPRFPTPLTKELSRRP